MNIFYVIFATNPQRNTTDLTYPHISADFL